MSTTKNRTVISFDASLTFDNYLNKNIIGIGIYNHTKNLKKSIVINDTVISGSYQAEAHALVQTLKYISKNKITGRVLIFTDNDSVFKNGLNESICQKYSLNKKDISLHWIPRELNKVADELSRGAKKLNPKNFLKTIQSYSYEQRINFLFALSNDVEKDIWRKINNKTLIPNKKNKTFLKLCNTIFNNNENKNLNSFLQKHNFFYKFSNIELYGYIKEKYKKNIIDKK